MSVEVSWLVVAGAVVLLVAAVGVGVALLVSRLRRGTGRRLGARRLVLEAQAEMLEEGPRLALVRLRLQLDEALGSIEAAGALGADVGDVGLLARRLQSAGGRVATQIDALLRSKTASTVVVGSVRAQVREIEALADRLGQAAVGVAGGAADVELDELRTGLEEQVAVVEARTKALRELTRRR